MDAGKFNIDEFLNSSVNINGESIPFHKRVAYLYFANGGMQVCGWGITTHDGTPQRGLNQDEAIELMNVSSFMAGLDAAGVTIAEALNPYLLAYFEENIKKAIH